MNTQLHRLFDALEIQRFQLLDRVKKRPAQFNVKPDHNRWSLHQVLAHLVAAEKLSVFYLRKKIQGIDQAGNTGLIEELKMVVLRISQRLPFKFKAPKPVIETTTAYSSLEALITDWDSTRANLKQLLEQIQDNQLKRKIFKHVIAGKLNIKHAVMFLQEHVAHHLPQVNRLLK